MTRVGRALARACAVACCVASLATGHAQGGAGFVASLVESRLEAAPGETVTLRLRLETLGDAAWTEPVVALPEGWTLALPAGRVELAPGRSYVVPIVVRVPEDAAARSFALRVDVPDRRSGRTLAFEATVQVVAVRSASFESHGAPPVVDDGRLEVRFVLYNDGNVADEWTLDGSATARFAAHVEPRHVALAPGGRAEVTLTAEAPATFARSARVLVTLRATAASGGDALVARAAAEVLPLPRPASTHHLLPVTVRFGAQGNSGGAVGLSSLTLRAAGSLGDAVDDHLDVRYRAPIGALGAPDVFAVAYRRAGRVLRVGDVHVAGSTFQSAVAGRGVGLGSTWTLARWTGRVDAVALRGADGAAFGVRATASSATGYQAAAGVVATAADVTADVSGTWRAPPAPVTALALTRADLAFAVRGRTGEPGALELALAGEAGLRAAFVGGVADLRQTYRSDGFDAGEGASAVTDLRVDLRLDHLFDRMDVPVRTSWAHRTAWSAADGVEHVDELGASADLGRIRVALRHTVAWSGADDQAVTLADLAATLGRGVTVGQRLAWTQPWASGESGHLDARTVAALPIGRGRLGVQVDVRLRPAPLRFEDLHARIRWSDPGDGRLSLGATLDLRPWARSWADLEATGRYAFDERQALDLALGVSTHRAGPLVLRFTIGYTASFGVPVSRRTTVGRVEGSLRDGLGAPLVGAIVRVGTGAARSDAAGRFVLHGIEPGDHPIQVEAASLPYAYPLPAPGTATRVDVVAGASVAVELRYVAGGAIEGRIAAVALTEGPERTVGPSTPAERWLAGATVVATRRSASGAEAGAAGAATGGDVTLRTVTGPAGGFRLTGLAPGIWTVRIEHPSLPADFLLSPAAVDVEVPAGGTADAGFELTAVQRTVRFQDGGTLTPLTPGTGK